MAPDQRLPPVVAFDAAYELQVQLKNVWSDGQEQLRRWRASHRSRQAPSKIQTGGKPSMMRRMCASSVTDSCSVISKSRRSRGKPVSPAARRVVRIQLCGS